MSSEAHFENINEIICDKIRNAKYSVCVAVTWLTDSKILNELRLSALKKIHVDVIIDKNDVNLSYSKSYSDLVNSGVNFFLFENKLMHNKFCIIDLRFLISGSYNYSNAAKNNNENIIVNDDEKLVFEFINEFKSLKENAILFKNFDNKTKIEIVSEKIKTEENYITEFDSYFNWPQFSCDENFDDNIFLETKVKRNFFSKQVFEFILSNIYYELSIDKNNLNRNPAKIFYPISDKIKVDYLKNKVEIDKKIEQIKTLTLNVFNVFDFDNCINILASIITSLNNKSCPFSKSLEIINVDFEDSRVRLEFIENLYLYRTNLFKEAKKVGVKLIIIPNNENVKLDSNTKEFDTKTAKYFPNDKRNINLKEHWQWPK